jgi:uncharacterized protein (DUF736 family)
VDTGCRTRSCSDKRLGSADSYRIHKMMAARVTTARSKRSNEGRDYLGLFTAPICAKLFDDEEDERYSLIWSRPSRRNAD